ncbi:MAG: hypothetical protein K6G52_08470 [Treponemataceae bacterium]|nr:hypothetical protein [Treponemataceae bacterium]
MLDEQFLTGLLGNEEVSVEDKIKQILGEHEADTRGLLQKRDELLGSEKKLKEKISAYEKGNEEFNSKINSLQEMLDKANAGDKKAEEYYNTKLADLQKNYDGQISTLTAERDQYKTQVLTSLRDKAIEEGTKNLTFVNGLKQGFIARVLQTNHFEPQEINGELKFLNKDNHTIEEAINTFALTPEGKAYIANPSTGGGAIGSSGIGNNTSFSKQVSGQQLATMSDEQIMDFALKGGKVV